MGRRQEGGHAVLYDGVTGWQGGGGDMFDGRPNHIHYHVYRSTW